MPATGMMVMAGASIAGPVLGGIIGSQQSAGARAAAERAAQEAYAEISNLQAPPDESKAIILKHFQKAGLYTPQLEQQVNAHFEQVKQSAAGKAGLDAQMGGLNLLKQRAEQGGLNATDRAQLNQIRQQASIDQHGKLEAIKQNMAARGMSGGGNELAQQLSAAQAAGSDESAASDRLAQQAQQAALSAASQSGQLGGQLNQQQFQQGAANTDIANREQQFNTENSIARQARNTQSQNQGQMYNINEDQRISDTNASMDNAEKLRQSVARRQYWGDQAQKAGMVAGARLGQAQQYQNQADSTAKMYQGIGSGLGAGAGAAMKYMGASAGSKSNGGVSPANHVDSQNELPDTGGVGMADGGEVEQPSWWDNIKSNLTTGSAAPANLPSPDSYGIKPRHGSYSDGGPVNLQPGGHVSGPELIPGDHPLNDIVHAKLSAGEVVVPKEVVEKGPDAGFGYLKGLLQGRK